MTMSYQHRIGTALHQRRGALAWMLAASNVVAGVTLTTAGYHVGVINIGAGLALTAIQVARGGDR